MILIECYQDVLVNSKYITHGRIPGYFCILDFLSGSLLLRSGPSRSIPSRSSRNYVNPLVNSLGIPQFAVEIHRGSQQLIVSGGFPLQLSLGGVSKGPQRGRGYAGGLGRFQGLQAWAWLYWLRLIGFLASLASLAQAWLYLLMFAYDWLMVLALRGLNSSCIGLGLLALWLAQCTKFY